MSPNRKKTKTPVKKNVKSAAKKVTRSVAKKPAKSQAKKKTTGVAGKKSKNPVKKQATTSVFEKPKSTAQVAAIPEAIKLREDVHSIPEHHEITPDRIEENKKIEEHKRLEHQFEKKEQVIMHQENQKMKSAMANREGRKRVFRTTRHR